MDLTSVERVKSYLRLDVSQTKDESLIQMLADSANAAITSAVSRELGSQQYAELYSGTGTSTLMLAQFPVTAVGAVSIIGPRCAVNIAPPTSPLVAGVDFAFTPYAIKLLRARFPVGVLNVQVEYTAGFTELPADICHAATKWAALRYREISRLGEKTASMQGQNITFDLDEMPPDILGIVTRYQTRLPNVGVATVTS